VRDLDWRLFKSTKVSADYKHAEFPPELEKLRGTRVRVGGSVFLLAGGAAGNRVHNMALMPPELLGCCGPACLPRLEWIIYVDCSERPWTKPPGGLALARVEGTLLIRDEKSHGCLFTLADAKVSAMEVPDFMTDVDYLRRTTAPGDNYDPSKDLRQLRETVEIDAGGGKKLRASSPRACEAARRAFSRVDLRGKAKREVLGLLGEPGTVSDFGVARAGRTDSPLIYRFDTGKDGRQYTVVFNGGKVVRVTVTGLQPRR
jgi:hypothetical protein